MESLQGVAAAVTDEEELRRFLGRLDAEAEGRLYTLSALLFEQYVEKRRPTGLEQAETDEAALLSDPVFRAVVDRWVDRVSDSELALRLVGWQRRFRAARVSAQPEIRDLVRSINDELVAFRYEVQGELLDLGAVRNVLRTEPNRERRRAAWMAFAPLSRRLAEQTRQLFRLRNQAARVEGFATYADMQLEAQGLSLQRVRTLLEELADRTEPAYRDVLQAAAQRAGITTVEPWDIRYLLDGEGGLPVRHFPRGGILPRLEEWGRLHGCELDRLGISVHFLDIPYNGLCMRLGRKDIRILGNPADGHNYYKTGFHELGHALHGAFVAVESYSLRFASSVWNEGMAEMMGYLVHDQDWLAHVGLTPAEIAAGERGALGPWFAYLRQRTAHALFEYAAYEDPDADLDLVNAEVEARLLGCTVDATPRWAGEPNAWYSRYPVYWQGYVLADMIASQIHHDLRRRFGKLWLNLEAVAFMREQYWAPGGAVEWEELLRRSTGAPLSVDALAADLAR